MFLSHSFMMINEPSKLHNIRKKTNANLIEMDVKCGRVTYEEVNTFSLNALN